MVSWGWDVGVGDPRSVLETGLGQSKAGLLPRLPLVRMRTPRPGTLSARVTRLRRPPPLHLSGVAPSIEPSLSSRPRGQTRWWDSASSPLASSSSPTTPPGLFSWYVCLPAPSRLHSWALHLAPCSRLLTSFKQLRCVRNWARWCLTRVSHETSRIAL